MRSCFVYLLLAQFVVVQAQVSGPTWDTTDWNKTRAIKEIPFCALVLREFHVKFDSSHNIHILMEPDEVTEDNLRLLFGILSRKDPESQIMQIFVETDVASLAPLATGVFIASSGGTKPSKTIEGTTQPVRQSAIYRRTKVGEFFRYNPNYPKSEGFKTVVLWGKEQL